MSTSPEGVEVEAKGGAAWGLLKTLRPHQWIKNLFVLAPLFFSKSFLDPRLLVLGFGAALIFSLTAGTVYLINDIFDLEKDRRHPVKKNRPLPAGVITVRMAAIAAGVLAVGTQSAAWLLDWRLGAVTSGYLGMNLAYSMRLKHVPFVDVSIIAAGFVLRVLAGAFAIDVFISEWLIICTFLLSLYLGFGKRLHELELVARGEATKVRKVLERYRVEHLEFAVLFIAGMTIAGYTIYTMTAALPEQPLRSEHTPFTSRYLPATIPLAVFGITRFYQLLRSDSPESPTELILKDAPFIANLLIWGVAMAVLGFYFSAPLSA